MVNDVRMSSYNYHKWQRFFCELNCTLEIIPILYRFGDILFHVSMFTGDELGNIEIIGTCFYTQNPMIHTLKIAK